VRNFKEHKGFSLIELMIVIAIISITLMLAVPAYSNFTTRAKLTELISLSSPYRISIAEYVATMGKLPPMKDAGFDRVVRKPSTWVHRIIIRRPKETVIFVEMRPSDNVSSELRRVQAVVLRGVLDERMSIDWDCGTYNSRSRTLPLKYLPASCRQILNYRGKV